MEKQKTAVCNTLLSVLTDEHRSAVESKEVAMKDVLTPDQKAKVRAIILEGLMTNKIEMTEQARAKHNTEALMKTYVSGLVNNWIKKNPDFNCGVKYEPKNKGSRAGQGDEQIKALRQLLKQTTDPQATDEINKAISERLAEIRPQQVVTINVDALPEHLKHLAK